MPGAHLTTLQCPSCKKTLPGRATQCQFCGTVLGANVQRPVDAYKGVVSNRKTWQEVVYIILAIYWIAQGAYGLAQAFKFVPNILVSIGGAGFIGIIASFNILMGIGLLQEATWAQFLAKILCWINLPFALLGYLYVFVSREPLVLFITNTWNVGLLVLQLYVIAVVGDA